MALNPDHTLRLGAALGLALAIAACAGGGPPPSKADVTRAVTAMMQSNYARFAASGAKGTLTVTRVQDLGCTAAPDGRGWLCQTVIATMAPTQGQRQVTRLVRLVRQGSGWQAVME